MHISLLNKMKTTSKKKEFNNLATEQIQIQILFLIDWLDTFK